MAARRGDTPAPGGRHARTAGRRSSKWLLAHTGGPTVPLHFGMTGLLLCARPDDAPEPHDRVLFTPARDRELRSLRGLWLAHDDAEAARLRRGWARTR
ncbi:DNA-formamidopyrimidine glycosylase family protein [Streptomyces sp. NPDC001260]|uniref:DNA-formamidopyrimidine glycosylase family protein n=1 Tax=Streptomyces sp. NPDC001260 TaxID=3364551 RepID=UPI0036822D55